MTGRFVLHRFVHRFSPGTVHYIAAAPFAFFGLDTVLAILTGYSVWEAVVATSADVPLAVV